MIVDTPLDLRERVANNLLGDAMLLVDRLHVRDTGQEHERKERARVAAERFLRIRPAANVLRRVALRPEEAVVHVPRQSRECRAVGDQFGSRDALEGDLTLLNELRTQEYETVRVHHPLGRFPMKFQTLDAFLYSQFGHDFFEFYGWYLRIHGSCRITRVLFPCAWSTSSVGHWQVP